METVEKIISEKIKPLVYIFENKVRIYTPINSTLLQKDDVIADHERSFPLGDERLIYRGQLNYYDRYVSLLCYGYSSQAMKLDDNGLAWFTFHKEHTKGMYIYLLKDICIVFKLSQEHKFESRQEAETFWNVCQERNKQIFKY